MTLTLCGLTGVSRAAETAEVTVAEAPAGKNEFSLEGDNNHVIIDANLNQLTAEEKAQGWKLLFNGENTEGRQSFSIDRVLPGWQVTDGKLVCQDPPSCRGSLHRRGLRVV